MSCYPAVATPMRNVEIKVRCDDLHPVHGILVGRGLKRVARMRQVDTYFDVRDGRLKLREIDGQARVELIGYRRPDLPTARTSTYTVSKVTDVEATRSVLSMVLGTRVVVAKIRDYYQWDNTRVHLDAVDGLGTFVELETALYGGQDDAAERECMEVFEALGLDEKHIVAASYADLLDAMRDDSRPIIVELEPDEIL